MQKLRDAWQQHRILETINRPHLKKSHLGWVIVGVLTAGMSFNATVVQAAPDQSTNIVETDKTTVGDAENVDPNSFDIKTDVVEKTTEKTATEKTVSTADVDKATAPKIEVQATANQVKEVAGVKTYQLQSVGTAAAGDLASGTFGTAKWTISVNGTLHIGAGSFRATSYSSPWSQYAGKIKKIVFDGAVVADANSSYLFANLNQVMAIEGLNKLDTHQVTNMSYMFDGMSGLTSLNLSNFDTSRVTNMSYMFREMSSLTSLDLSNFDTHQVTRMNSMFRYMSSLTSLDLSSFDTSQVTDMSYMFYGMSRLTSLDVSNFKTIKVTKMDAMFSGMSSLTSLYVSNFDTSQVTNMSYMFKDMSSLTSLDVSNFKTIKVTKMKNMFYVMPKLNQITFGVNFDTSAVTSDSAVLPNVSGIKQWRQVGSGTVAKPAGKFRNSATINTTEPVVADTYVLGTYTVVDFWKSNVDTHTYGVAGLENYISSTDPFGNGNVKYVHNLTAADQTEVLAKGIFGTAKWYISMDGTLHIGAGEFAAPTSDSLPSSPWSQYADKIKKIVFDGVVVANADSTGLFTNLNQVTAIEGLNKLDTHQVTNMSFMFNRMSSLTSLDVSNFDTSQVTRMNSMFQSMSSLTSLNVSNFDTSQVTNMYYMFAGMSNLTSFDLSNFNTSQVTNMSYMFSSMSRLTSLDVSDFDTSQVTDTGGMFSGMSSLTSLDVSNFDTSQVTDMSSMFKDMSRLTSLDVSNFKTIKVTNMYYMFSGMSSLTSLDLSNFDTSQVKYMYDMFSGMSNLTSLDLSNFNTSKVTKMSSMFEGMSKLKQIRFGANFDTSAAGSFLPSLPNAGIKQWRQVGSGTVAKPAGKIRSSATINTTEPVVADTYVLGTYIVADFWKPRAANTYGVAGLENYISSTDPFGNGNVTYVNDLTAADQTEVLAKGIFGTAKWYISIDGVLHIGAGEFAETNNDTSYSYDYSPWYAYADKIKKIMFDGDVVANADSHGLFWGLDQVTAIEGLNKLDTHQVTNMDGMFNGMSSLTSLDLSNFDTSQVTTMQYMFYDMSSLTSLDLSGFDTGQVTDMDGMFGGMSSLTSLDLSNFDTSQVTTMYGMFSKMGKLTSLDVSNFDTSHVTSMSDMFGEMSSLTSLDLSNFDTSQVTTMYGMLGGMFYGMSKLNQITFGANFDTSAVTYGAVVLPNVAGIQQWRQVGSGTIAKPTGAFRNSEIINTTEPVVADTYVLDTYTVVDFWKQNADTNTYGVSGLENYISSTDPFGNGNVKYVHELTAADQTEVLAKGIFGTAKWYIGMDGTLHIGSGEFAATNSGSPWYAYADKIKKIVFDGDVVANAKSNKLFDRLSHVTAIEGLNKLDTHQVINMRYMFGRMSSLTSLDLSNFDTSQVTDMSWMFVGMSSLASLDLSGFDTSRVLNMAGVFRGMSSLTSLNVSNFDTSQVTDMNNMFYGMSSLASLDLSGFDTSRVLNMAGVFRGMSSLTSLNVSNFDTRQVTDMNDMFYDMSSLTSLDLSGFDTGQVTDMSSMFSGMYNLISLDLSNFDTSKVTSMWGMFHEMSSLTSLDLSDFNTSQVTDMSSMFYLMSSLTSLDVSNFDTSKVTNMNYIFYKMPNLNRITFGANFDTSAVRYYPVVLPNVYDSKQWRQVGSGTVDNPTGAFRNSATIDTTEPVVADTYVLDTHTVVDFWKIGYNTSTNTGTYGVAGLEHYISSTDPFGNGNVKYVNDLTAADQTEVLAKGIFGTAKWYISMDGVLHIGAGEFAVANGGYSWNTGDDSPWYAYADKIKKIMFDGDVVANADSHNLFKDLNQVTSIEGLNKLDTHQVTNMTAMFRGMSSLTSLDVSNFYTSQVTNMTDMFANMSSLASLDVSNFYTSQVTNMTDMFANMSSLASLDLSNFDTSQVTNMQYMFSGMSSLTSLDVSKFDTSRVTNMQYMFGWLSSLTSLDLSNFDTSQVTNMTDMFNGMSSLTSLDLSNFDTSRVTNMPYMFSYMSSLTSLDVSNFNTSQVTSMSSMFSGMLKLNRIKFGANFDTSAVTSVAAVLPNVAGIKQWRQVGSGTVDKPTGAVRSSATINKTNPVVADTYVFDAYTVVDFWKPNAANTYGVTGLENYISSTDPFGNGNVKYVHELTAADQTEVLAKGIFGTSKWYIGMDGTLHIGAGEFAAVANSGSSYSQDDDSPWYAYADKIKKIVFDGSVVANTDSHSLFGYLNQVASIEGLNNLDTHQVTDMKYMFSNMSSLTSLDLSNFNTSQVIDMNRMFSGMSSLTSLDLSSLDTSQVTNMNSMFAEMSSLTSLDLSSFNTSQVTNMSRMFYGMSSLTSLDVSNFNTSHVTYMNSMFAGMSSLTSLDLSKFNTGQVTTMSSMFFGMSSLASLDLSGFDTSQATNMSYMFGKMSYGMPELNQITFGANFDTSVAGSVVLPNVADSKQWRQVGSGTVDNPAGAFRNSATIDTTEPVVADTYVLDTYTVVDFWKPNAANTYGVTGLENYISSTDPFGNGSVKYVHELTVADQTEVLAKGIFGTAKWYISMDGILHIGAGEFAAVDDDSPWNAYDDKIKKIVFDGDVVANANSGYLFDRLNQVTSIEGLNKLDTHQVTNMQYMFNKMSSLTSLDVSNFDTSQVMYMSHMFNEMGKLTSLDVSNFDTSQVTRMNSIFDGMSSLTSLDLSNFNTSQVITMSSMFSGMSSLTSLDLSSFDTSQVTTMSYMFNGMSSLTSLDLSNFDTSQVTNMSWMFRDMSKLNQITFGANFDTSAARSAVLPNVSGIKQWRQVGSGTVDNPTGAFRISAKIDTTEPVVADTYVLATHTVVDFWKKGYNTNTYGVAGLENYISSTDPFGNGNVKYVNDLTAADQTEVLAKGIFGTAKWYISMDGVLHIGAGEFAATNSDSSSYDDSPWYGYADQIKKIVFDGSVVANADSHNLFGGLNQVTAIEGLNKLDTHQVTNMSHMFNEMYRLTNLDLSSFDTSQVTNMNYMFHNMSSLTSLDLSGFDTSQVTDMGFMFSDMSLTSLDVSNFDTSQVIDMNNMFSDMSSLTSLDVFNFDTSQVIDMYAMFYGVRKLTSLDLSNFDTSQVTNMQFMFSGMIELNQIKFGANFDTSAVTSDSADLPNASGIKQWRQVGSGTVDKPAGEFRSSETINTTEPVVADTYVLTDKTQQYVITVKDDTGDLMPNVKLGFYDQNGNLVATVETDANGVASVSLPIYDYTVKQVSDVKNHDAADNLNVLQDNPTGTMTLSWQTTSSNMLPVTGSQGMLAMMTAGLVLLFGLLGFSLKKNKKDLQ